ncbi:hypothetical protein [Pseudomonas syringae group genomosp. 7]|uniref:hypothetical protein n=1 Tax=Pseudomonas syringae group genomosp. 7 TaxID=251699 RepID=UPI0013965B8A|nr:hypothetical protein [Pseudomonas syringae group genomosp. 7]UNB65994.1 hypothetical protein MME54_08790 [Pseudomonas syringae pv. helianthi]
MLNHDGTGATVTLKKAVRVEDLEMMAVTVKAVVAGDAQALLTVRVEKKTAPARSYEL